jgi:hypothetical protein
MIMTDISLAICKPEATMEEQLEHVGRELEEALLALARFRRNGTSKNRAEILFELLDIMNAAQTAIYMEFADDEISAGVTNINSKNYVRHYLRGERL